MGPRAAGGAAVTVAALVIGASPAGAGAPIPPPGLATARLQGAFELAGRVTVAKAVAGERAGEAVQRIWTFTSTCPSGQCPTVGLVRRRAAASDALVMTRTGPGSYSGNDSFYAPLRCAGRIYPRGEKVPFRITVQVTTVSGPGAAAVATRINASYVNPKRINRTRCVAALGRDSVRYHGFLIAT
jgi:hypothetical protein